MPVNFLTESLGLGIIKKITDIIFNSRKKTQYTKELVKHY